MTQINLLPWREKKREQEKKKFMISFAASALVAVCIVLSINYYAVSLVDNQTERNNLLQREIKLLDEQIKEIRTLKKTRKALISRMGIVQNLQSTRTLMVHLFDELINIMPAGVYVTKLERKDDIVTVYGYSESNTNISELMRNIENNQWIQKPALSEIKNLDGEKNQQPADNAFKLNFIMKSKY